MPLAYTEKVYDTRRPQHNRPAVLARCYARPIRTNAKLADDAKVMLLPDDMYRNTMPGNDLNAWEDTTKKLPQLWQEQVLIHVQ